MHSIHSSRHTNLCWFFLIFIRMVFVSKHELPINGGLTVRYILNGQLSIFARYSLHVIRSSHTMNGLRLHDCYPCITVNMLLHLLEVSKIHVYFFSFFIFIFFFMMIIMKKDEDETDSLLDNSHFENIKHAVNTTWFAAIIVTIWNCWLYKQKECIFLHSSDNQENRFL